MNAPVTRRALLGATAAAGVVALPARVVAVTAPAHAHPDAELFAALDSYPATRAAMREAGDRCEALWEAFAELEPQRPEALHERHSDRFGIACACYRLPDGRKVGIYEPNDVTALRAMPLPTREEWRGEPAPWNSDEQVGRWVQVPDERRIVRRAEILAAHDRWWAECQVIKDRLGIPAVDAADERATDAFHALVAVILTTAPATCAGLAAKARWALECPLGACFAADWHHQIVEDVVALAERGGVRS